MRLINTIVAVAFLAMGASAQWPDCPIEAETPGCTCDDLIDYYCGLNNCPTYYCTQPGFTISENPGQVSNFGFVLLRFRVFHKI
jgi:hypothetical protein